MFIAHGSNHINQHAFLYCTFVEIYSQLKEYNDSTPDKIVARHIKSIKAAMEGEAVVKTPLSTKSEEPEWIRYSYSDRRVVKRALDNALRAAAGKALVGSKHFMHRLVDAVLVVYWHFLNL